MDLISIIIAIVILGLIIWGVGFLPIDQRFKSIIMVIAIIFVLVWFAQSLGWIGSVRGGSQVAIR